MKHISEKKVDQFIDLVNKEYKAHGESDLFYKCIQTCKKTGNIPFIIEFCARVNGVNAAEHFGNYIVENGTLEQNLIFAQRVKTANRQLHFDFIASSKDPELCLVAAKTLPGVDVAKGAKVVLEKGSYLTKYLFSRDVDNDEIDYEAFQDAIFKSNNVNLIYAFALDCKESDLYKCFIKLKEIGASQEQCYDVYKNMTSRIKLKVQLEELEQDILRGKTHVSKQKRDAIVYYAKQIFKSSGRNQDIIDCEDLCIKFGNANLLIDLVKTNNFDVNKLSRRIAEVGNGLQNYEFMSYIYNWSNEHPETKFDVDAVLAVNNKSVLDYGDAYSSYLVAKNIHPANIEEHEELVIKSKDSLINTYYARDVKGADIAKHQQVVMENGSVNDILLFIKQVKGANLEEAYKFLQEKGADPKTLKSLENKLNNEQKINIIIDELNK